jgi:hypothetical protein
MNNTKVYATLITVLFILIAATASIIITKYMSKIIETEKEKYESKIGKRIVLNKDTLMITNYSLISSSFKLENGAEVSCKLVEQLECIDENK